MEQISNPQPLPTEKIGELFSRLIEDSRDLFYRYEIRPRRGFRYLNAASVSITGYTPEEHYADPSLGQDLIPDEIPAEGPVVRSWRRRDGTLIWTEQQNFAVYDQTGELVAIDGIARDVTEREQILQALRIENERFLRFFDANIVGVVIADAAGHVLMANDYFLKILDVTRQEFLEGRVNWREFTPPEWGPADEKALRELSERGLCVPYEKEFIRTDGTRVPVYVADAMLPGPERQIAAFILDITERRLAEKALQASHSQLQRAEQIGQLGNWEWMVQEDRWFLSDGLYRLLGLELADFGATSQAYLECVHPQDVEAVRHALSAAVEQRAHFEFESRMVRADGEVRHLYTRGEVLVDETGRTERLIGAVVDTTERVQAEEVLQRLAQDLHRSNAELEQFAYVASHDLQEPLRMVSSYLQLLARRYQGRLDQDADEFIGYAVDGAKRMQNLINDLLAYSRVGTRGSPFATVSMEEIFQTTISNLEIVIQETQTNITHDPLPTVHGDPVQLGTILQNLLTNAIKFRGEGTPYVHVGVKEEEGEWIFSVSDSGIGIDPKFAERIFVIFQRLNAPGSYPGTGIGLAICKRIVERHGGRIWVESLPEQGATFYFSISKEKSL